jgi:23S rRNA (cytidine1920-2'-O)/16S rRNA (cytidine1409-2'-O)-methyltransferase
VAADAPQKFVSRAGAKLEHALEEFKLDVPGLRCADFGCNVGGFTDCLLQRGAKHVIAIDTGYGALAWKLRQDPRVETRERTNALHAEAPAGGVDLVVLDLAWTPQRLAIPAALKWLAPGGRIITLIKPHYELRDEEKAWLDRGFLPHERVPGVVTRVEAEMPALGAKVLGSTQSPLVGGKTSKKAGVPGNIEWLTLLEACAPRGS